jgi:hypothetical protein
VDKKGCIQGYIVYRCGDSYRVRGQLDGVEVKVTHRADEAIQHAVDLVGGEGGEVALQRGEFPLQRPVRLASRVWLHGSGRGTRLLVRGEGEEGLGLLCAGLKGCTVSDLAVLADPDGERIAGIALDDCGDCTVRDVLCQGFARYGIWVRNNSFLCQIESCKLAGNGRANLYLDRLAGGGRGGDFLPNLVTNCITYGGGTGIECHRVIVLNIVGCAVFQPGRYAYHLHHTSNSVLISGCRSFQVEEHAVVVENTHELNVSSNIFCWHRGHGIVLRDVSWGAINGNEFIDQGVRARDGAPTNGIVLSEGTQGVQVVGNTIFNWGDQVPLGVGILEDASCRNNLIRSNNINFYTEVDVCSQGEGTLVGEQVSAKEAAYQGMGRPGYPDFDRTAIERFIGE